jgi:capsular polysaccharide biosynthesis protein
MGIRVKSKQVLYPATAVRRAVPVNLIREDEIFFRSEFEKELAPVFLYALKRVNVSAEGIVFSGASVFPPSLINESRKKYFGWRYLLAQYLKRKKITLPDECYVLAFDEWSNGYFHWLCDALPRLIALKKKVRDAIVLLPESYSDAYISESLQLIGFERVKIIPERSYVDVRNLLMPGHVASSGNYNRENLQQLQDAFGVDSTPLESGLNVFVSRKKARYRYIMNENEVLDALKLYNFSVVYLEDYNLAEKIKLINQVRVMIGMHGANFTNMLFMKKNSFALEFRKRGDQNNNAYFSFASELQINYLYQFCDFSNSNYTHPNNFDIHVDIEELKKNLEIIFRK